MALAACLVDGGNTAMTLHFSFTKTININIQDDIHIQNPAVLKLGSLLSVLFHAVSPWGIIISKDKSVTEMHHLIRMHLIGDPSAPGNLKGKQWTEYIPGSTSSSFKASTRMISLPSRKTRWDGIKSSYAATDK